MDLVLPRTYRNSLTLLVYGTSPTSTVRHGCGKDAQYPASRIEMLSRARRFGLLLAEHNNRTKVLSEAERRG